jgi:hypothetical protein
VRASKKYIRISIFDRADDNEARLIQHHDANSKKNGFWAILHIKDKIVCS